MNNIPDCQYEYYYEEPKAIVITNCEECDSDICENEEYYEIEGHVFCTVCIQEHKYTAEIS